ncbi:MAG TPA: response regulator transcription factor [Ktedonobacterales bacterium]
MSETPPIRILLCEDQTLMREGLRTVLELEPGFQVAGEAADGAEGVRLAEEVRLDIVLMDVQMPRQNGVQATAAITARGLPCRVIILTTFDYEDYVFDAIKAGAVGYLLKDTPASELAATIRRVSAGESFIQPKVATKLLMEFGRRGTLGASPTGVMSGSGVGASTIATGDNGDLSDLSQREVDVLRLLAQGAGNRDIAEQLVLAEGTVKNHVSNILAKLHAANRTQAANLARERGLI